MNVTSHAPGPLRHGVVRHARLVERLAEPHGVSSVGGTADLTHAQFTDALFGPDVAAAAAAFEAWAATARRPLVVTLHDVPGADPDPARDARRARGYERVASAADAVVVSSAHEAANLRRSTGHTAEVIPLPVEILPRGGARPDWAGRPTLAVLGFVYPGKGHAEAIDAAARSAVECSAAARSAAACSAAARSAAACSAAACSAAARSAGAPLVVALGAVADGHAALHRDLRERAADRGVDLHVTGSLTDADLAAAAGAATVPLAPARRVSASGSLATWIGCGRRPIAARGPYTAELAARHPGGLRLYDTDAELDAAIAAARADPAESTTAPHAGPDVGAAHAALYRRVLGC